MLEIAIKNGIKPNTYNARVRMGWTEEKAATKPVMIQNYKGDIAIYEGEKIKAIGTVEECAEELDWKITYVKWLLSPSGRKRSKENPDVITAIRLDVEEGEW